MIEVSKIWRHPIKSHGCEEIAAVSLYNGQAMPFDRIWAVAHDASKIDNNTASWMPCVNFSRGAKAPALMAIEAKLDEADRRITLTHPDLDTISLRPDDPEDANRLIEWVTPICPQDRALPKAIYSLPERGLTDTKFPSVSILNVNSLRDLSEKAQTEVSDRRFRGNIWVEGAPAWGEFEWIGQEIQIGTSKLKIVERIKRCTATLANPSTGIRDLKTLDLLQDNWGHQDFGVAAEVIESGDVAIGDTVVV